ncbi:MAG: MoaD/ThiS family protein [Desulfatiglandales bacterium]|jgi:molybdopterin converting factor small subunit|nr:MoaD/ThiS family protein [Desulfatiglandales bacterium]
MYRVKVKYLNVYYSITGKKEELIEFDDSLTLGELLEKAARSNKPKFRDFIFDDGNKLRSYVWIFLNRERTKDFSRELKDGEVVVFSLPIVGG